MVVKLPVLRIFVYNFRESSIQRMSILKLNDASGTAAATAAAMGSVRAMQKSFSLLELFLQATGVCQVQKHLALCNPDTDLSMLSFVAVLCQLMYPFASFTQKKDI